MELVAPTRIHFLRIGLPRDFTAARTAQRRDCGFYSRMSDFTGRNKWFQKTEGHGEGREKATTVRLNGGPGGQAIVYICT